MTYRHDCIDSSINEKLSDHRQTDLLSWCQEGVFAVQADLVWSTVSIIRTAFDFLSQPSIAFNIPDTTQAYGDDQFFPLGGSDQWESLAGIGGDEWHDIEYAIETIPFKVPYGQIEFAVNEPTVRKEVVLGGGAATVFDFSSDLIGDPGVAQEGRYISYIDNPQNRWPNAPNNMVDGNPALGAFSGRATVRQTNDDTNLTGAGKVTKIEVRARCWIGATPNACYLLPNYGGFGGTNGNQYDLMASVGTPSGGYVWSDWLDITNDPLRPAAGIWTMNGDVKHRLNIQVNFVNDPADGGSDWCYCSQVEIRVNYIPLGPNDNFETPGVNGVSDVETERWDLGNTNSTNPAIAADYVWPVETDPNDDFETGTLNTYRWNPGNNNSVDPVVSPDA